MTIFDNRGGPVFTLLEIPAYMYSVGYFYFCSDMYGGVINYRVNSYNARRTDADYCYYRQTTATNPDS